MKRCSEENCEEKSRSRGLCNKHYARLLKAGTLEPIYDYNKYSEVDTIKDTRPGHRGLLSINIINDIKYKAIQRVKTWNLMHKEAFKLITSSCHYCNFKPTWPENRVGIDRVNNLVGYEISNCVPCCFSCNSAKKEFTEQEFINWIKQVYEHFIMKGN